MLQTRSTSWLPWALTASVVLGAALVLLFMGRVPICECGYVKLWHGDTMSSENSQHLTDWYTPSHIIHGLIFYAVLQGLAPRMAISWRLFIATLVETAWEILENSPIIIERYRTVTISLDYYGDSVVNAVADILAMIIGFWLAQRLPVWASVALVLAFEVVTTLVIRDGLTLNILMLLWPLDALRVWQAGG